MTGELGSFDILPPELVDRIVAWYGVKYGDDRRRVNAIDGLRQFHGIPPEHGAQMVDQALWLVRSPIMLLKACPQRVVM